MAATGQLYYRPDRILGMTVDITVQKRAEESLRLFRKMIDESNDAIEVVDPKTLRYLDVNDTCCRHLGYTRDELLSLNVSDVDPAVNETLAGQIQEAFDQSGGVIFESLHRRKDGSTFPVEVNLKRVKLDRAYDIRVVRDITERKQAQQARLESEDKLRLILDSTAEGIYGTDLEGRCTFCNPAGLRMLGYEHVDDLIGRDMHSLLHPSRGDGTPGPADECRCCRATRAGERVHVDDEVLRRADDTSFPAEYWCYPQWRGGQLIGAVVAFFDITQRKLVEAAFASVRGKLIQAQEQERNRIARDLHDDIGQRLALLALGLAQLQQSPDTSPALVFRLRDLQKQASGIAVDIQSLSHGLHSARLDYLDICTAIRGFCREFAEKQKVEIDFRPHDLPGRLSPDISLCLFRVLQEALNNAAKHSGVRHFEVRLWGVSDEIHLTVSDSGSGFDREAAWADPGLGLISMEERLSFLNGTLRIDSRPRGGTTIHARLPLKSEIKSLPATG